MIFKTALVTFRLTSKRDFFFLPLLLLQLRVCDGTRHELSLLVCYGASRRLLVPGVRSCLFGELLVVHHAPCHGTQRKDVLLTVNQYA